MITTTFIMEKHIGHRAYYQNLRRFIEPLTQIRSHWVDVTYCSPYRKSMFEHLPFLPVNILHSLIGRQQVLSGLDQQSYDIAFFNTQVPATLASRLVRKRPYIISSDITPIQYDQMAEHYGHQPDRGGLISRYKHWVNMSIFRDASYILPWSTWVRDSLITDYGVSADKIEVIPPGVDTNLWAPAPSKKTFQQEELRILFVGGDFYRKGGDILLEAFQALPSGAASLHLVTRQPLSSCQGVRIYNDMQPNSPDLVALYQSCHLFVLPTRAEAFGIAAVEASSTGLPVIATNVGGLSDIVVHGETGFLIAPDDKDALTKYLLILLNSPNLRRRFAEGARARVEKRFDAHQNALRIFEIIKKLTI